MKESYLTKNNSYFALIFFSIAISLFAPRGIGFSLSGSVIDITELLILFIFFLSLPFLQLTRSLDKIFVTSLVLPIFFVFLREDVFLSLQRYIFFFFFSFSGFFIGKHIYKKIIKQGFAEIVSWLMIVNSTALSIYFLNDYFSIVDLSSLRAYDTASSEYLASVSRNLGITSFDNFIGYSVVMNSYAIHQSILFYIGSTTYFMLYSQVPKKLRFLFFFSIIISIASLALSQSRGPLVFSILLLFSFTIWDLFFRKEGKVGVAANPIVLLMLSTLLLFIYFFDQIIFIFSNLSTLLNYFDLAGYDGLIIQDSTSKRINALNLVPLLIVLYPYSVLIGLGEGFWGYIGGDQFTLFGDLGILITYLFEFGIISWILFMAYLILNLSSLLKRGDKVSSVLFIVAIFSIMSLMITSMKDSYWLFFLVIGFISEHNNTYEGLHNHNSIR